MKILFVNSSMNIGGAEKSLVNLVNLLSNRNDIEIDIMLLNKEGELLNEVSPKVRVYESNDNIKSLGIPLKKFFHVNLNLKFKMISRILHKIFGRYNKFIKKCIDSQIIKESYDVVISYASSFIADNIIINNFKTIKKFVYLHSDFELSKFTNDDFDRIKSFDKILCVSESCINDFVKAKPELKEKFEFIYNIVPNKEIIEKSKLDQIIYSEDKFVILSVSRLRKEKGHLRTLKIMKKLFNAGYDFEWHIIGDGDCKEEIESFIKENSMENYIKMHGFKSNPYPYYVNSDLFLLTSYQESFGIVLVEAMILRLPVFSTKTISADEIVGDYGFVVGNTDEDIYQGLKKLLENKKLIKSKKTLLQNFLYDNETIIDKFLNLIKI